MELNLQYVTVFVVLINAALSIKEEDYFYNDKNPVQSYDSAINNFNREITNNNVPPAPRYEVTEHVIDIPDDKDPKGPIVTNYKSTKPLNKVTNAVGRNGDKKQFNKNNNEKVNVDNSKYYHSIHESEYSEHSSKNIVQKIHEDIIPNIREFIQGPKGSLRKGFHNAVNKEFNNPNKVFLLPNIVAAPVSFLNKFHKKSKIEAKNAHQTIFGQEFNDYNDDYF